MFRYFLLGVLYGVFLGIWIQYLTEAKIQYDREAR